MGAMRSFLFLALLAVFGHQIHGRPESTGTSINPCAAIRCAAGTACVVKQVQCFTTPCNPIGSCEPINEPKKNTCETTVCQEGYKCIMKQVQCIRAPCPPLPECVKY